MPTATSSNLHYSPKLGRYARCVAEQQCEYGDAHTSLAGLARSGGAEVSTNGHGQVQIVSPIVGGAFSVGTDKQRQTFRGDGSKLTPSEARRWRDTIAQATKDSDGVTSRLDPTLLPSLGWGEGPKRAQAPVRHTTASDFALAESSSDSGVLVQAAHSADPGVRLVVAQNPATATHTLEGLATSTDDGSKLYRDQAHTELRHRYQDMRDAAELEACERMDRDGVFQMRLQEMPSYRQLVYMPAKRWEQKPVKARRSLIQRAMQESGQMLRLSFRFGGWTLRKQLPARHGQGPGQAHQDPGSRRGLSLNPGGRGFPG
jgi:hypothetical protein